MDSAYHQPHQFPLVCWNDRFVTFRTVEGMDSWPDKADVSLLFGLFENRLLLVDIEHRGWSVPGGHIEQGESIEHALRRETWEEAGAHIQQLIPFGIFEFKNKPNAPVGSIVPCYIGDISSFEPLPLGSESRGVMLVPISQIQRFYYMWDPLIQAVFQALSDGYALSR